VTTDDLLVKDFTTTFAALAEIGRDPESGGMRRLAWTPEDREARSWFADQAAERGMAFDRDRNGNLWAWWGDPDKADSGSALVFGSHLDTVPDGGAFDGALGVVGGFLAVSAAARGGATPNRPVAVVSFADEEGARFGVPTLGSRLLTGAIEPAEIFNRRDSSGETLAHAMRGAGLAPGDLGPDPSLLERIGAYVELHIEQGRGLVGKGAPVGVGSGIWPHGRWRLHLLGDVNHAGTTPLSDRRDPMLVLAQAVLTARERASQLGAMATIGKVVTWPNNTNSVPGTVDAWLDARASNEVALDDLVDSIRIEVRLAGARHGVSSDFVCESRSPEVDFDLDVRIRLRRFLTDADLPALEIPTSAGHDAGALATAGVPAAMVFVRNPSGASHTPTEFANEADCVSGCQVLTRLVEEWCRA
jgi:beta-ureidopropionase / N-carbamoyl-L-amino-acid hydrolase